MSAIITPISVVMIKFWSKVDKSGEHWLWLGAKTSKGYGKLRALGHTPNKSGYIEAHRFIYIVTYGPIGELSILHHCDVPACVKPEHLFTGTQADNIHDMWAKGRASSPPTFRGSACNLSKLSEEQAHWIFKLHAKGKTQKEIALAVGCNQQNVSSILLGKTWSHLNLTQR